MTAALRTQVEDAVIDALGVLLQTRPGGYLTAVQPYNGPVPPDADDAAFARLVERGTPVVGVTAEGEVTYEATGVTMTHRYARAVGSIDVIAVSGNVRSQEAHLRGDEIDSDPGLYAIAENVRDALWGVGLGVAGAGLLDPTKETITRVSERFTAAVLSYTVPLFVEAQDAEGDAGEYESIRQNINNADDDTIDPVLQGDTDLT